MAMGTKPPVGAVLEHGHPLARGLAGAWLFNEGRGDMLWDLSGHGHTGTLTGMDPPNDWVSGPYGHSLDFDGTDDRVIIGPEAGINFGTANTCIIRLRVLALKGTLVGHKAYTDGGYFLAINTTGVYYCANGAYVSVAHGMTVDDEVWLGVSRQGTSVTFYKNGRLLGAAQTLSANNTLAISAIGCYRTASMTYAANMRCDYVYCWNRSLSEAEMAWLYREPFCFVARGTVLPMIQVAASTIHNASGSATAVSLASATAAVVHADELPTGRPWPQATLHIEASWLREALLNGMTDTAMKLGTVLTHGWFWTRQAGATAVYRCEDSKGEFRNPDLTAVAAVDARRISLPTYLAHEPQSSYCYIVRRFNGCGRQDRTMAAMACVHIGPDGHLKLPAPNTVFDLKAGQVSGKRIKLTSFYWPLGQEVAPRLFTIYWDGGTGEIDFVNVLASLPYDGRRFYNHQSQPLSDGRYSFAVRAESAAGMESPLKILEGCEVRGSVPVQAIILEGEAI